MSLLKIKKYTRSKGFTLIEILVVIGIIAVLAAVVLIAINPARQFAQARDSQRTANVGAVLNAIGQNIADNQGTFTCTSTIPTAAKKIGSGATELDLRDCLVPNYIPELPVDPATGEACIDDNDDGNCDDGYKTEYTVEVTDSSRIRVCATESEEALNTDPICITR